MDSKAYEDSLFVISFHVWNGGIVAELPITEWQRAAGGGVAPPVAFAFHVGERTPIAAVQQVGDQSASVVGWPIELLLLSADRRTRVRDTVRIGMAADLSDITFDDGGQLPAQSLGPPAQAGPIVVVVDDGGYWSAFSGPRAFEDSGVSSAFKREVIELLRRAGDSAPERLRTAGLGSDPFR